MRNAALAPSYVPESTQVASGFLGELREAHGELLAELASMDELTRLPAYDCVRCATGRWKISQASLMRRVLSNRICDYLLVRCLPAEADGIRSLQDADRAQLRRSADHVARWTAAAIEHDWRGYCRASQEIRWQMQAQLAVEQRVLYAILERAARRRD